MQIREPHVQHSIAALAMLAAAIAAYFGYQSSNSYKATERPFVWVQYVYFAKVAAGSDDFLVVVRVVNEGKSQALLHKVALEWTDPGEKMDAIDNVSSDNINTLQVYLPTNRSYDDPTEFPGGKAGFAELYRKKQTMSFYGFVQYGDEFGGMHTSKYCFEFVPSAANGAGNFYACQSKKWSERD